MKVLIVHNYYQQSGGEDAVVAAEQTLLENRGHDTRLYAVNNDAVKGLKAKLATACKVHYSASAYKNLKVEIRGFNPDIVHMHNFFPLLTPSVYDACRDLQVPVVQTLHNFRVVCPGALFMIKGKVCERCLDGSPYHAVFRRCYRNSLSGSLAVARMVAYHRNRGTWQHKVDRFIALTEFARAKFIEAGFPTEKIVVKPNFTQVMRSDDVVKARRGALFVGRLSAEKGIQTLLNAWRALDVPVRIAGDGPLGEMLLSAGVEQITYLGKLSRAELSAEMDNAAFLVMPSVWYESFGLVLIEAFAHGLPVIASRMGSMAEIVADGITGLHFEAGNAEDLAAKVLYAVDHPEEMRVMGDNARKTYEQKYTPEANYRQLVNIYEYVLINRKGGSLC